MLVTVAAANVAKTPTLRLSNLAVGDTISPAIAAGDTTDGVPAEINPKSALILPFDDDIKL